MLHKFGVLFSWSKPAIDLLRVLTILAVYDAVAPPALAQVHFPRVSPSRDFTTSITPGGANTQVQFGNGTLGQTPPAGAYNIKGTYRVGSGTGRVPRYRH